MCLFVVIFFLHPVACLTTLALFSCKPVDGNLIVFAEPTEICFGHRHLRWVLAVGIPGVIFILGIPIFTYLRLSNKRGDIKFVERRVTRTFAFIFADFKQEMCYWEAVIQSRKLFMGAAVVIFVPWGTSIQALAALGFLCIAIALQVRFRPFQEPLIDQLEIVSLLSSFLTLYFGLLLDQPILSKEIGVVITFCVIFVNIFFLVCYLWSAWQLVRGRVYSDAHQDPDNPAGVLQYTCRKYFFKMCGRCCWTEKWPKEKDESPYAAPPRIEKKPSRHHLPDASRLDAHAAGAPSWHAHVTAAKLSALPGPWQRYIGGDRSPHKDADTAIMDPEHHRQSEGQDLEMKDMGGTPSSVQERDTTITPPTPPLEPSNDEVVLLTVNNPINQ